MAVDAKLRLYIERSLAKAIVDGLTGYTVQTPGTRSEVASTVDDWFTFHPLAIPRIPSRKGTWHGRVMFQITVFSRYGEQRSDRRLDMVFELAAAVQALLDDNSVAILKYGGDDSVLGCLKLGPSDEVYQDEGDLGLAHRSTKPTEVSNIHSLVLTFVGTMFVS